MANIALITNNILSDSGTAITSVLSGSGTTNYLSKFTGSTVLGNSLIYDNGTAVGIGTNNPSYKLQVDAGTNIAAFRSVGPGENNKQIVLSSGGDRVVIAASNASDGTDTNLAFNTAGNERMRIASSGNVLIGTTTDGGQKLQVAGEIKMAGTTYHGIFGSNSASWAGGTNYPTLYSNTGDGWIMHINPHISYTQNGVNGFSGSMTGSTIRFASNASASNYWDLGVGTNSVGADTFSIGRGGVNYVKLNTNRNLLVGPSNDYTRISVSNGNSTRTGITLSDGNTASLMLFAGNSTLASISFDTYGLRFVGGSTAGTDNGSEYMRISSTGNVGIGTTSPGYKLDVAGETRISTGNIGNIIILEGTSGRYVQFGTDGGGQYIEQVGTNAAAAYRTLRIQNSNGAGAYTQLIFDGNNQKIYTSSNANVLIGTGTDNGQRLQVSGNVAVTGITATGNKRLSLGILDINSGGTPGQIRINTTIPFASGSADFTVNIKGFRYGLAQMVSLSIGWHYYLSSFYNKNAVSSGSWTPTVTLACDAGGYVVIHLSSPDYWPKLYVESVYSSAYGDAYSSGWTWTDADLSNCTSVTSVTCKPLATDITGNSGSTSAVSGTTNYISKFTSSSAIGNSLIYDNGTNVGIGTTSPLVALDVRGTVIITNQAGGNYNENLRLPESTSGYASITLGGSIAASGTSAAQWTLVKFPTTNNFSIRNNNSDHITVFPTGNLAIGNSTDGGYKLDVVGNTVRIAYSAYAGIEYHNTIGTWEGYIGTENGSGNLRYNSRQGAHTWYYNSTATMTLTSGGNLGVGTTSPAYKLQVAGDIGFTSAANRYLTMQSPSTSGSGGNMIIQSASANTSGTGGNLYLYVGGGAGGPGPGKIYIGNNNGWDVAYVTGILTVSSTGPNTGDVLRVSGGGRNALTIAWDNLTPFMSYSLVSGRQSRFLNSSSYYFDNNFLIGTTTDGGYKLNVNGNGNFILGNSGYIRLQSGSGQRHGYIQSAFSNFLFSNNIYYDGSNWRYDQNGYGAQIQTETLSVGVIAFNTFASGTAGNVATIIESMRIVNNGNILMGTTTDSGYKLDVNGTSRFTNSISLTGSNRYIGTNASNLSIYITGGSSYLDGAYFNLTGNTYGASPGAGSAEFVIRTNSDSKFALFGYNGSSWSRYMTLYGPTGNLNIGSGTTDSGYKLRIEGNTYNDGEIISVGNITTNASAYVNANQSGYNLTVYPDITSGPNNLYSGGQVKANIYTSSNLNPVMVVPSTSQVVMAWYPSTTQGVFIDYTLWIYGGANAMRSGTFMVVNDSSGNVQYTDIATPDLNASTALATLAAANNGGVMEVTLSNGSGNVVFINTVTRYIPTMV